jgi:hypothetical protein
VDIQPNILPMDPLSIITGAVTLIAAADSLVNALRKLRSLQGSKGEIDALINEVSDLQAVLSDIESTLVDRRTASVCTSSMPSMLDRAQAKLLELDGIIKESLINSTGSKFSLPITQWKWSKEKPRINGIQDELRSMRLNLVAGLGAINWYVILIGFILRR